MTALSDTRDAFVNQAAVHGVIQAAQRDEWAAAFDRAPVAVTKKLGTCLAKGMPATGPEHVRAAASRPPRRPMPRSSGQRAADEMHRRDVAARRLVAARKAGAP